MTFTTADPAQWMQVQPSYYAAGNYVMCATTHDNVQKTMGTWPLNGQPMIDNYTYCGYLQQDENAHTNMVIPNTAWDPISCNLENAANYQNGGVYVAVPCKVNPPLQGQLTEWETLSYAQDDESGSWDEPSYLTNSSQRRRRRQRAKQTQTMVSEGQDDACGDENRTDLHYHPLKSAVARLGADLRQKFQILEKSQSELADVRAAIDEVRGNVLALSFDKDGCYAVQSSLELAERTVQQQLAQEMWGHVKRAIASPHANYVVAKIVEVLPPSHSSFIVLELLGDGARAARHTFGCRVINRLIEHSIAAPAAGDVKTALVEEILREAGELCRHQFGHHVMSTLLEHGRPDHKSAIVQALVQDLHGNCRHRRATYVIEKAMAWAQQDDVRMLERCLVAEGKHNIIDLAENQFGCHVVKTLMQQTILGENGDQQFSDAALFVQEVLRGNAGKLKENKFSVKLVDELEKVLS